MSMYNKTRWLVIAAGVLFMIGFVGSLGVFILRLILGVFAAIGAFFAAIVLAGLFSACNGQQQVDLNEVYSALFLFIVTFVIGGLVCTFVYLFAGIFTLVWQTDVYRHRRALIATGITGVILGSIGYLSTIQTMIVELALISILYLTILLIIPLAASILSIIAGIIAAYSEPV